MLLLNLSHTCLHSIGDLVSAYALQDEHFLELVEVRFPVSWQLLLVRGGTVEDLLEVPSLDLKILGQVGKTGKSWEGQEILPHPLGNPVGGGVGELIGHHYTTSDEQMPLVLHSEFINFCIHFPPYKYINAIPPLP